MRAVVIEAFGGPEVLVLRDVPEPTPAVGEVVVRVEFANLTFVETQVRAGTGPFPVELPMVPGNGVGGTVVELGEDVDPRWAGRRVVSALRGSGGDAELAVADSTALIEVPEALGLDTAVALLADGRTATLLVRGAEVGPGDRVLVEAAGGGVGTLLVQLAAAAGARVVAAAGRPDKLDLARDLGAEVTVDYSAPDWAEQIRAAVGGLDVVFDGVGGEIGRTAFGLLEPGGRMSSFGRSSGEWAGVTEEDAASAQVTLVPGPFAPPDQLRAASEAAIRSAAEGRLRPIIGQRFALEDIARAHDAIESRSTTGKTLLVL